MTDIEDSARELELQIQRSSRANGLAADTCVIKRGPQVFKTISLMTINDPETGKVKKRELRAHSWKRTRQRDAFIETQNHWHCENEEIDMLQAFLNEQVATSGRYRLVRSGSDFESLLRQVEHGEIGVNDLARFVESAGNLPAFVSALAASDHGLLLAEAIEVQRRKEGLAKLRSIVEDPRSTEPQIHAELKKHTWVFGGRYVGEAVRRELAAGDELDIPLLQADGSLHVVELKKARIPKIVVRHRSHLIPGPEVHEAVCQVTNYLRGLDEERNTVLTKYKIECRRALATVIIGHSAFARDVDQEQVYETLRTYNSHVARIEVLTYDQLLDAADRTLAFIEPKEGKANPIYPEIDINP